MTWRRSRIVPLSLVLSLVCFVLGHDMVFLVTYGSAFRAGLARTGHGDAWTFAVVSTLLIATCLVVFGVRRLGQLSRLADDVDRGVLRMRGGRPLELVRLTLTLWAIVLVTGVAAFVLAENVEHHLAGLPLPGLSVLGSTEYADTPLVFAVVALATALVGALYLWRRDILGARIAAARVRWPRAAWRPAPSTGLDAGLRPSSITCLGLSVRAPPLA